MKAVIAPKYNKNYQEVPIQLYDMPQVVTLWASGGCNFCCRYCIQSSDRQTKVNEKFPAEQIMTWDTFLLCMEQIKEFGKTLPAIVFCGIGEPLLNPRLADMIHYIKSNRLASHVELVTNGVLLTEEKSRALVDAGLDLMSVSIQGVTKEAYRKICGVDCDIDKLVKRLTFFSEYKTKCHLHIKTVDIALNSKEEYKIFFEMFGDIADSIFVDHVFPLFKNVDYSDIITKERDQYTGELLKRDENYPCTLLFQALYVQPDGMIVSCCTSPVPMIFGSIYSTTLKDVWNSDARKKLLLSHLKGKRRENPACAECVQPEILNSYQGIEAMGLEQLIQSLENECGRYCDLI